MKNSLELKDFKDGMLVTVRFRDTTYARNARISIEEDHIFVCQNLKDGTVCTDKKGFTYSWKIYSPIRDKVYRPKIYNVISVYKHPNNKFLK